MEATSSSSGPIGGFRKRSSVDSSAGKSSRRKLYPWQAKYEAARPGRIDSISRATKISNSEIIKLIMEYDTRFCIMCGSATTMAEAKIDEEVSELCTSLLQATSSLSLEVIEGLNNICGTRGNRFCISCMMKI
mmetsp:Transcript_36582/g.70913  ORF Transcript_36582/g.70913 Transcript_36582/m.70913 type:complete len:133 (-) Transcript_36582:66-464(-)